MNTNELELSRHEQAQSLHQQVMTSGALAAENIFDMAKALKDIRDGKFYKELGYGNFESYCEEKAGMKRRNAYNYIAIAERINSKNVQSIAQIGMTKLALLASLSEEKQAEVAETVDLESVSVRELKEEINRMKGEKLKLENEREKLNAKLEAEAANAEEARSDLKRAEKELKVAQIKSAAEMDRANRTADKLRDKEREAARLERENKELRERPVEVAVEDHSEEYELKLKQALDKERKKLNKEKKELEKELEKDFQDEARKIRQDYESRLNEANAKAANGFDGEKEQFKVFLVMAHDALARLIQAAEKNGTETYRDKVRDLLAHAIERTEDIECREQ